MAGFLIASVPGNAVFCIAYSVVNCLFIRKGDRLLRPIPVAYVYVLVYVCMLTEIS